MLNLRMNNILTANTVINPGFFISCFVSPVLCAEIHQRDRIVLRKQFPTMIQDFSQGLPWREETFH